MCIAAEVHIDALSRSCPSWFLTVAGVLRMLRLNCLIRSWCRRSWSTSHRLDSSRNVAANAPKIQYICTAWISLDTLKMIEGSKSIDSIQFCFTSLCFFTLLYLESWLFIALEKSCHQPSARNKVCGQVDTANLLQPKWLKSPASNVATQCNTMQHNATYSKFLRPDQNDQNTRRICLGSTN